jgi:hypothetical protein
MSRPTAPSIRPRRLFLLSMVFAVAGVVQFLWFSLRATRGPGGELEGVTLALGNTEALTRMGVFATIGLVVALVARHGRSQPRFSLVAIWLNSLSLVYVGVAILAGLFLRPPA